MTPGVLETAVVRLQRWVARMDGPALHSAEPLLRLCDDGRGGDREDVERKIFMGATHAAVESGAVSAETLVLLAAGEAHDCRVFSGNRSGPPLWRSLQLVELRPMGMRSFEDVEPFWGCVLAAGSALADLRYSVSPELREDLVWLRDRPSARLAFGRREFDLLDLVTAPNAPGVANAIRRARLGCVFEAAGDLWGAIEVRQRGPQ